MSGAVLAKDLWNGSVAGDADLLVDTKLSWNLDDGAELLLAARNRELRSCTGRGRRLFNISRRGEACVPVVLRQEWWWLSVVLRTGQSMVRKAS